jgi:ubiquinone biosynthesis protein COQ9
MIRLLEHSKHMCETRPEYQDMIIRQMNHIASPLLLYGAVSDIFIDVCQALALQALPQNAPSAFANLARTADTAWTHAGDRAVDASWCG